MGGAETPQGTALTSTLPGGDSLQVHSLGVVSRVRPDGTTVWQRGTASLYRDWHLTFDQDGFVPTPQLAMGTDPADPFELTSAQPFAMDDTHPYAVGDLTGDGTADVAVAETVGVNLGAADCGRCGFPFSVPGSELHLGTFVTVLDGSAGTTLYSTLEPGLVTQLAVAGRDLVIGDETGSPGSAGGVGAWDSVTTVRALTLQGSRGALKAKEQWHYSTGAQWGRLLGLQVVGTRVAVAWSDTPLGLGVPGPPDGHVVLIDGHGRVNWDHRTAGYPVLSSYDASRNLLAVVEETDPTAGVSYTLAGLRTADGASVSTSRTDDVLPTAMTIGELTAHHGTSWIVAGVRTTADQVSPPNYSYTAAAVTTVDPGSGRTGWSRSLAAGAHGPQQPGAVAVIPGVRGPATIVAGSWFETVSPTPAAPVEENNDVRGLSGTTGAQQWQHSGEVADPLSLAVSGAGVRGVTAAQRMVEYDGADGRITGNAPLLSDFYAAVPADTDGDGRLDSVAGGLSGALYAIDDAGLTPAADDLPRPLWRADVGGPVHQIVPFLAGGRHLLAVAATTGLAMVDQRTGRVLHRMKLPGQYTWNVAVGTAGGRPVVVTATDRLSAFDATTGKTLWTYRPPQASYFANASVTDGIVVSEFQGQDDPAAASAVGIDGRSGQTSWTAPADPATTAAAQLHNGVVSGPGIPGAGQYGAAFTFVTADGQGRTDVRDARTGSLLYSNTDPALTNHEAYLLDSRAGLVATGDLGSVTIRPQGAVPSTVSGTAAAVADAQGTPVLLTANVGVSAYPMSALAVSDDFVEPLAVYSPFEVGQLSPAGDSQVLATPIDWRVHQVLSVESGLRPRPYNLPAQHGLLTLSLTGTPAADAAGRATKAPRAKVLSRPDTVPLGAADSARIATARPAGVVKVRGYAADGSPLLAGTSPSGKDPDTMRAYLGLRGTGAGQTVAVVDAPGDPAIAADVNAFSARFGLHQVCTGSEGPDCFHFTVATPDGIGAVDPQWGLETAMDVEWVHAVAPDAAVVLVEAHDGSFASLFHAVDAAAGLRPDAISLSWGVSGEFTDETYYDGHCRIADSLCVVASGDRGHPGGYPAYNPSALAVGGTTLGLTDDGAVTGETAWSGSGGGRSYVERAPGYQQGVPAGGRGVPDVSFEADPAAGVAVYDSTPFQGQTGWFQVGGTSLGAPAWAAVLASADQLRETAGKARLTSAGGLAQRTVYAAAGRIGDITEGPVNGFCPDICQAGRGYDFVTGLGSPRAGLDATLASAH